MIIKLSACYQEQLCLIQDSIAKNMLKTESLPSGEGLLVIEHTFQYVLRIGKIVLSCNDNDIILYCKGFEPRRRPINLDVKLISGFSAGAPLSEVGNLLRLFKEITGVNEERRHLKQLTVKIDIGYSYIPDHLPEFVMQNFNSYHI